MRLFFRQWRLGRQLDGESGDKAESFVFAFIDLTRHTDTRRAEVALPWAYLDNTIWTGTSGINIGLHFSHNSFYKGG